MGEDARTRRTGAVPSSFLEALPNGADAQQAPEEPPARRRPTHRMSSPFEAAAGESSWQLSAAEDQEVRLVNEHGDGWSDIELVSDPTEPDGGSRAVLKLAASLSSDSGA